MSDATTIIGEADALPLTPPPDGFAVCPPHEGEGGCIAVAATRYRQLHRLRLNGRTRIHLKGYPHA
jgi:hypothetical protein